MKSVIQSKDWKFLNEKILLSVLEQESELEPFFSKDDKQYKANMRVASGALSMTEPQVLKLVTLKNGQIAKFRLETGYFFSKKWEKLSPLRGSTGLLAGVLDRKWHVMVFLIKFQSINGQLNA